MSDSVKPSPSVSGDAPAFAPSPSGGLGVVQSPGLDLDCPGDSPTPTPVGGGGLQRDGGFETQPRPAATRQPFDKLRAAKSRCPSPEGVGEVVVQPRTGRHNQWTRAKMVAFLRELAATQSVAAAARAVGMSRTSAYNLRNRLAGQPFALGWEVALECGMHALAHAVMDRAVNGEEVPLYYHGELVGTTRRYDNRLAQWILENPWRVGRHQMAREYAAGGFDALLERIESASLDWEAGEPVPGPGWPLEEDAAAAAEAQFQRASWYSAEAAETARPARRRGRGFS